MATSSNTSLQISQTNSSINIKTESTEITAASTALISNSNGTLTSSSTSSQIKIESEIPSANLTNPTTSTATSSTTATPSNPSAAASTTASTTTPTATSSTEICWIFPAEKIENSPSRVDGLTAEQEIHERQQAALFISDLASLLRVNQLCVNTAIIYMHRFFMIHSFKKFHRYVRMVATSCLFLACKVEEQPRRLREFTEAIQTLFHRSNESVSHTIEESRKYGEEIVYLESCLLQTLGFNVLINHAHTFIIKTCQMIKAPRDLAEAAYLTATNSLILTNFCVKYSSEKIACFCIYLACKWTGLIIPTSSEGLQWYQYVKHDIVEQELEDISKEYLAIYDKCLPMTQKKLGKAKTAGDDSSNQSSTQRQQNHPNPHHQQQHRNIPSQTKRPNPHSDMHPPHNVQSHNVNNYQQHQQQNNSKPHHQQHPHVQQQQSHKNPSLPNGGHHPNHSHGQQQQQQQQQRQHPHHPTHYAQQAQQQQAQRQHQQTQNQNLNKSLPIPQSSTHKQHPHSQQQQSHSMKHPSSSNLNPNKSNSNGMNQNANQNGANFQTSLNIKSENESLNTSSSSKSVFNPNTNQNKKPMPNLNGSNSFNSGIKLSPSTPSSSATATSTSSSSTANLNLNTSTTTTTSMKRGNEEMNNITSAPNKIPKFVIDQKSAS